MRGRHHFTYIVLTILPFVTGCTSYEYDIVQPPEVAQHVGSDADVVFTRSPLLYRFRTYENHLVVQIHNPTTQPIALMGGQSFLVDAQGQSHPLLTQTIGPSAFVKLILPPPSPEFVPARPVFQIDVGSGRVEPYGPGLYTPIDDPFWYSPRYYIAVGPDGPGWNWEGEGDVRMGLIFQPWGGRPFEQQFVFHRHKM